MTTDELQEAAAGDTEAPEEPQPLNLETKIESRSACQRHITVTVSREDIDRYYEDTYSEMMETAVVPGFRAGRAPRKLVESRFRKEVTEQIKGSLLLDSMTQVNDEQSLAAISEPVIDFDAIEIPDEGPLTFEFDLEVRPDFDLPQWKGLKIERPTRQFDAADVDRQLGVLLASTGRRVPTNEPARDGDYLALDMEVTHDGKTVSKVSEQAVHIRPTLSFRDARIDGFAKLMDGVRVADRRQTQTTLSADAPNQELAGKEVTVAFEVLDVKKFELPELTDALLAEIGDFDSEGDLRDAVLESLERQLQYKQRQVVRQQISQLLTESADWELPPELLRRQSNRELERSVLELRRSGFSEAAIRAHANELRQNSQQQTAAALREHFILERIAEEEEIDAGPEDFDQEIALIAKQSGESPRRVRARLEKQDLTDALRNQIIERKVLETVEQHAKISDVTFELERQDVEAVDLALGGGDKPEIPVAEHGEAESLSEPKDHT